MQYELVSAPIHMHFVHVELWPHSVQSVENSKLNEIITSLNMNTACLCSLSALNWHYNILKYYLP